MANVYWTIRNYDLDGNGVTAADMTPIETVSNQVKHATNRGIQFHLNGIDELGLTLYLDDPMALKIKRLRNVLKVWRTIFDDDGNLIYADPFTYPVFAGLVAYTGKQGDANTMDIRAYAPFWRLQSRFHTHNHYLKTNIDTQEDYKQSEMLWKIIDLINNAFNIVNSFTGIIKGTFSTGNDPVVAPIFIPRGSNAWTNFDSVMTRFGGPAGAGSVDLVPTYYHADGDDTYMIFNTEEKRGDDLSSSIDLRYHTGTNDNLDDFSEVSEIVPGEFGNYLWAVGQGGTNSGKIAVQANVNEDEDSYTELGIYMVRKDFPDIKRLGLKVGPQGLPTHLQAIAPAEFAQARVPRKEYSCSVSPAGGIYYGKDFNLGDVVMLNASKGALQVSNLKQRIFDPTISISDNNIETVNVDIADDFYGKVAP